MEKINQCTQCGGPGCNINSLGSQNSFEIQAHKLFRNGYSFLSYSIKCVLLIFTNKF